jgi:uncharacterized 2Fe-2S/4Fe-4S cluster protein (DUF4445 family)
MTAKHHIIFAPSGRRIDLSAGETVLAAAQQAGIGLIAICDGLGTCHQCIVRLVEGDLNSPTGIERQVFSDSRLASGLRLACQAVPISDVTIEIPPDSTPTNQRLQVEGLDVDIQPDPAIELVDLIAEPGSDQDGFLTFKQINQILSDRHLATSITSEFLEKLFEGRDDKRSSTTMVLHETGRVVDLVRRGQSLCGLALDIGTTKLAAYLVDLESGHTLAMGGTSNPQIAYGEDVISRIAYANQGEAETAKLHGVLVDGINDLVVEICQAGKVDRHHILDAVAVGNTAMHHLFAGLPTRQLGEAPYEPARRDPLNLPVDSLGLDLAPGALVHLPPLIAGFVGSDHIAADLVCGLMGPGDITLLVDIGTNTEITLRTPEGLFCCSCASGPAFEGAHIHAGMRAAAGAIERVFYDQQGWHILTIDDMDPVGICGSGILDAVSELHRVGVIDDRGTLRKDADGVERIPQGWAFRLTNTATGSRSDGIHVTRQDINEVQLAKAAIRTGIEVLLKENKLRANQVERIIIAGAFGTYLHLASALAIGMFPDLPEDRFEQVGNAAGAGARLILVSKKARQEALEVQKQMRYIELTTVRDFQDIYMAALPVSSHLVFPGT